MKFTNFSNLKIQNKITLTAVSQFIFVFVLIIILVIFFVSKQVNQDAKDKLVSIAQSRSNHIETYLEDQVQLLQLVTSRTTLRKTLAHYNEKAEDADLVTVTNIIKDAITPIPQFERICILGLTGKVLSSTDDKYCGKIMPDADFFIAGLKTEGIYFIEEDGVYKTYISGPIILEGKVLGVGVTVMNFNDLESLITDRTSLGKTGEVLVSFNNEAGERKYPIKRLFEAEALPLNMQSEETAYPMKQALAGKAEYFENTLDYRNERVSAASSFVEIANFGLVAKIDRSELSEANRQILLYFILIFIIFVSIYYLISKKVSNIISKPIVDLYRGTLEVEKGNLDYSFSSMSQDETGQLVRSFAQMTRSIKDSKSQIERKVEEQTKDIQNKAKELLNQRSAIMNILEDVEKDKNKFEQVSSKLSLATKSAHIGVWEWDVVKNIITWDEEMYKIYGIKKGDFGGAYEAWQQGLHPDDKKAGDEAIQKALKGEKDFTIVFRVVWPTGEIKFVQAYALVERDNSGKPLKMVGINFDVTHEKEVDKAKSEFVSLASHQLRTPLSTINWYAEMILDGDVGAITEDQKKYLEEIYSANKRMVELVNSLLNVSKIDLGTFTVEPEPVDLKDVVKNVLSELQDKISKKNIKIKEELEVLPKIDLDPKLIHIVFQNLISNAVKYTHEEVLVEISIKTHTDKVAGFTSDKGIMIMVKDNGLGIPVKDREKMFTKLFRADNATEYESEGTGLGLYIVKSIIEGANGKIWFESEENRGTTFFALIPFEGMKKKVGAKPLV